MSKKFDPEGKNMTNGIPTNVKALKTCKAFKFEKGEAILQCSDH